MERFKKFMLLMGSSIAISKMSTLSFYGGALGGYFFARCLSGKSVGQHGKLKSIVFSIGSYRIHIHHWILSTLSIISLVLKGFHLYFFEIFLPACGFCVAVIFHGIYHYTDWYKIIYKNENLPSV